MEKIETPTLKLSKPTTKIVVDPSVNILSFRSNKSGHLSLQQFYEISNSQISPTKHLLMLSKNFMPHFVEHVSMLLLELMIWIKYKVLFDTLQKIQRLFTLFP